MSDFTDDGEASWVAHRAEVDAARTSEEVDPLQGLLERAHRWNRPVRSVVLLAIGEDGRSSVVDQRNFVGDLPERKPPPSDEELVARLDAKRA